MTDFKEFVSNGMPVRLVRKEEDSFDWYELRNDDFGGSHFVLITSLDKKDLPSVLNALNQGEAK